MIKGRGANCEARPDASHILLHYPPPHPPTRPRHLTCAPSRSSEPPPPCQCPYPYPCHLLPLLHSGHSTHCHWRQTTHCPPLEHVLRWAAPPPSSPAQQQVQRHTSATGVAQVRQNKPRQDVRETWEGLGRGMRLVRPTCLCLAKKSVFESVFESS